jgi:thiol-disulfide isomerase/thioredoxin
MKGFDSISQRATARLLFIGLFVISAVVLPAFAQSTGPGTTKIDSTLMRQLLTPKERPLLVNFWATWCDPCREEFPDLVIIDKEFSGKIDFLIISLDDPTDLDKAVPAFLNEMGATMPSFLLSTTDEDEAINWVSKNWGGALPFTILYNKDGSVAFSRLGKVSAARLRQEITPLISADNSRVGSP